MHRYFIVLVAIYLSVGTSYAQSQWSWVEQTHNDGGVGDAVIASDSLGNVYTAGSFSWGYLWMETDTLHNSGGCIYVAKYDTSGNEIWVRQFGNASNAGRVYGIECDNNGNVYVTGIFQYANFIVGGDTLYNNGTSGDDFYLVKMDGSGNIIWSNSHGGTATDYSFDICCDPTGVYITGMFNNGFNYGSYSMTNPSGLANMFVSKYSHGGQLIWAICGAGVNQSMGKAICSDGFGNLYVCGRYNGSLSFGFQFLPTIGGSNHAMYVSRLDSLGNCAWARSAGGLTQYNEWNDVTTDTWGNIYLTGSHCQSSLTFGTISYPNPAGVASIFFIGKYDSAGNEIWGATTTSASFGNSIARDRSGNIYVTGMFGYFAAGSMVYDGTTLWRGPNDHNPDFILMIDTSGSLNCSAVVGCGSSPKFSASQTGAAVYYASNPEITFTLDSFTLSNPLNFYYNIWGKWSCDAISLGVPIEILNALPAVYPNPTHDRLTISMDANSDVETVYLYDASGRLTLQEQVDNRKNIELNLTPLESGVYNLIVGDVVVRVVKE